MAITPPRSKVLFLPVVRGMYDPSMTQAVKSALRAAAQELGVDAIFPADDAYTDGLVCKDRDVRAYWQTWSGQLADIKALIAFSSDFMDERSIMDTARLLPADAPVFLMVNNDDPQTQAAGGTVGDSLCGSLSVHHNLRMIGRSVTRSCRINMNDAALLETKLREYLTVIDGIEALRHLRVALLGVNPTSFATTFTNQLELFRLGFSLHTYELLDMWGSVVLGGQLSGQESTFDGELGQVNLIRPIRRDDPDLAGARERIASVGCKLSGPEEQLDRLARCFLWIERTFERDFIDAGAIHCWPEFARYFGARPCAAAMLANVLLDKPVVCEVDVCHAIMAKLARAMSGEPGVILDVNNNGWDPRVFNVFHCSQTPPSWLVDGGEITDEGTVTGVVRPVPFTGVSAATSSDAFHATVFAGHFLAEDPGRRGSSGWAFVPNCQNVLSAIEQHGIHHFVAMKGHRAAAVCDVLRFKGLVVNDMAAPVPPLHQIESELPTPGTEQCRGLRVYSK